MPPAAEKKISCKPPPIVEVVEVQQKDVPISREWVATLNGKVNAQIRVLAQTELNRRLVVVQLYLALGGGWNLTDADWQKHTVTPVATNPPSMHP